MQKEEQLQLIAEEVNSCTRCALHRSRKKGVPGSGNAHAEIMFIGEGPGFHENEQGLPFVGAAGKFLDELLASINLKREDVFITNVVKCRPPENRDPETSELAACDEYLERQIQIINPKVIVTLGRFSMAKFLPNVKISVVHGSPKLVNQHLIVPMFHPAAALHQAAIKPKIQADFLRLPQIIASLEKKLGQKSPQQDENANSYPSGLFSLLSTPSDNEQILTNNTTVDDNKKESVAPTQLSLF